MLLGREMGIFALFLEITQGYQKSHTNDSSEHFPVFRTFLTHDFRLLHVSILIISLSMILLY